MNKLTNREKAKRIYYLVYGKEPKKGDELTLADSMEFASLATALSDWAMIQGFNAKTKRR